MKTDGADSIRYENNGGPSPSFPGPDPWNTPGGDSAGNLGESSSIRSGFPPARE